MLKLKLGKKFAPMGFLQTWYYRSLSENRNEKSKHNWSMEALCPESIEVSEGKEPPFTNLKKDANLERKSKRKF